MVLGTDPHERRPGPLGVRGLTPAGGPVVPRSRAWYVLAFLVLDEQIQQLAELVGQHLVNQVACRLRSTPGTEPLLLLAACSPADDSLERRRRGRRSARSGRPPWRGRQAGDMPELQPQGAGVRLGWGRGCLAGDRPALALQPPAAARSAAGQHAAVPCAIGTGHPSQRPIGSGDPGFTKRGSPGARRPASRRAGTGRTGSCSYGRLGPRA